MRYALHGAALEVFMRLKTQDRLKSMFGPNKHSIRATIDGQSQNLSFVDHNFNFTFTSVTQDGYECTVSVLENEEPVLDPLPCNKTTGKSVA